MADVLEGVASVKTETFTQGEKLPDAVTLRIGSKIYDSWESIEIERSMENVSSGFRVSFSDKWRGSLEKWPLTPGSPLRVNIGDKPVINGYIDTLNVGIDGNSRTMEISGRDRVSDIIDCSAIGTNELKDVTIEDIAIKFATELFGLGVIVDTDVGEKFPVWTINQGETVFETLQRAAKQRGVLLQSDSNGDLVITNRSSAEAAKPTAKNLQKTFDFTASLASKAGTNKTSVDLIQGENVLEASASYSTTNRFSNYLVKGQMPSKENFNGKKANQVQATASDLGAGRFRPKVIIADGNIDIEGAKKRANWEASTRAAKSMDITIKVQGWLQKPGGDLWKPNELVRVEVGFIGIKGTLLISNVSYIKDASGTFSVLNLTRADAFSPDLDKIEEKEEEELGWLRKLS